MGHTLNSRGHEMKQMGLREISLKAVLEIGVGRGMRVLLGYLKETGLRKRIER